MDRKPGWKKCYNYPSKSNYLFDWRGHPDESGWALNPLDIPVQQAVAESFLPYTKSNDWKITYTTNKLFSELELEFNELAKKWKMETGVFSIDRDRINDTFLDIISLGKNVIPFILKDMQKPTGTARWHIALKVLAKTNPVSIEELNKSNIIKEKWIRWGKENNII